MNTVTSGLLICLVGNFLFATATPPYLIRSVSEFSNDLYGAVTAGKTSNVVISPFSVYMALSLALMGAKGRTSGQMARALKLRGLRSEISEEIHRFFIAIESSSMLKVANKIYVMENYRIKPKFNTIAREKFHSESESLDFARAEAPAAAINRWVEDKTNSKIRNLISSSALGEDTRMVLVNAIHFKGVWQHQFVEFYTKKSQFYTNETDSVMVDMMYTEEYFDYGELYDLNAKAIELPYKDSDMSLLVILPNQRAGLAQLEERIRDITVEDLTNRMRGTKVNVYLPKFKIEFEESLVDAFKKLGMRKMFTHSADFSGILETTEPIHISDVIHKTFIDVNESGTEAAASTAFLAGSATSYSEPPPTFRADRPFRFILKKGNYAIFIGRYSNL